MIKDLTKVFVISAAILLIIYLIFNFASLALEGDKYNQEAATSQKLQPAAEIAPPMRLFEPASEIQLDKIGYFLDEGLSIRNAHTAKNEATRQTAAGYFVAAEIVNSGGFVGVWWHGGDIEAPGMVLAVDHIADEACVCPWVRNTQSAISMDDPPARELKKYVSKLTN